MAVKNLKIVIFGLILMISAFMFADDQLEAGKSERGEGKTVSRTFVIASSNNFPPVNMLDREGNLTGFGRDLSTAVIKEVGGTIKYIHSPYWIQVLEWLETGKADFIHDTGYTRERDVFLDYSDPIMEMPEVIFVRSDYYAIRDLDSIKLKKVACVEKHITHLYLQNFPEINCIIVQTPTQGIYGLINGDVDAFVYPKQIVLYLVQQLRLEDKIKITGDPLRILSWSMTVKEGNREVVQLLNEGLKRVRESGEYERIYKKWFGSYILAGFSKRELLVITSLTTAASVTVVLSLSLFFFNRRLRKDKSTLIFEMTERTKAEEALQRARDELEERVKKRTYELDKANIRLKELDQLKSMFIASISHELRTPLNSIIGFTGIVLDGMSGEVNPGQKEQLNRVYRSARHLLVMINDIIDISKIEAGKVEVFPEEFSVREIIDEASGSIQHRLNEKGLNFEVNVPSDLQMNTDRKLLLQCILNLLSNAVKFTERGTVGITAREVGNMLEIAVSDTGIGITEKDIPKVFKPFERLETRLKVKAGGTGLGLYQTKKIAAEILSGTISVKSEEGKGTTFFLKIPKDIEQAGLLKITGDKGEKE